MSGICGIIQFDGAPAKPEHLETMIAAAPHRARDGATRWTRDAVAFAYLATEVGPVEERGDQPVVDEEAGLTLVAHARLDNRARLDHVLRQAGLRSGSAPSDAELILGAYKHWGTSCAEKIVGDFAFALWDARKRRLFAARDPMAMRPFYYHRGSGGFRFASEIKQLLALADVPETLREAAIANFLAGRFGDLSGTFFEDVHQLPPAHALLATADTTQIWKYWEPDAGQRIHYKSEDEYAEHFRELLLEAARVRFRSPQPAGLMLSGGLDSGAVASLGGYLKQQGELACPDLCTYSWAFPTLPECDERFISDEIVQPYNLPATYIDAEEHAPLKTYPAYAPDPDTPFMGVYDPLVDAALRQARKDGVGYFFSGHRADLLIGEWIFNYLELFRSGRWVRLWRELRAHHRRYAVTPRHTWKRYFWNPVRASLWPHDRLPRTRALLKHVWHRPRSSGNDGSPFPPWMPAHLAQLLEPYPQEEPLPDGLGTHSRKWRYRSIFIPMHMHVAASSEQMAARHHLVTSDIWTDRRLVQFVLAVPPDVLCRAGENKRLLRKATKGVIPEAARTKARKISPQPLYDRALRTHTGLIKNTLFAGSEAARHRYVDEETLLRKYQAFLDGEASFDERTWYALTLEMWLQTRVIP